MRLRILREAEEDIVEAVRWYESISVELAVRFLNEIGDGLASIERHPERYSIHPIPKVDLTYAVIGLSRSNI